MIVTRQRRIPFIWVIMAMMPWAFWYFQNQVGQINFLILNRLIDNPAKLTFVLGLPGLMFTIIPLGAFISYKSDLIWTRWGRRKPFIIFALSGWVIVFTLYPLAPNIWFFLGLMFIMSFFGAFGSPLETLKLEIIPPYLRGRSAALWSWITTLINIVFFAVVFGRFDDVMPVFHMHLSGEKVLFWSAGLAVSVALFIYIFGIHEINPQSEITGEPFRIGTMWKAITMPQLRYLYILLFATTFLNANLGSMGQLLYLNQWGYTAQEFGFNVAVGGILNLFLIPLIGIFADAGKNNRMAVYLGSLALVLLLNIGYFCYVTFYLPDQRPSLVEIIFFGETTCVAGIISGMVYYPLVYDYIPRNIMGTYAAGTSILQAIIGFVTSNLLGLFMATWSSIFQPPAGEMVRVCLKQEMPQAKIMRLLSEAHLKAPSGNAVNTSDISARPWFATGIVQDTGRCFEIRCRDDDADKKARQRDQLLTEIGTIEINLKDAKGASASADKIHSLQAQLDSKTSEEQSLDSELKRRSSAWEKAVVAGLGNYVIESGAEIVSERATQAVVFSLPLLRKPSETELDKLNRLMRSRDDGFIGVRTVAAAAGEFTFSAAAELEPGNDPAASAASICRQLSQLGPKAAARLISPAAVPTLITVDPVAVEEVATAEDPSKFFLSPISRGVRFIISRFTEVPAPDQKLHSLARELCKDEQIKHARVDSTRDGTGLRVIAVTDAQHIKNSAAWHSGLLKDIREQAASLKLTVLSPVTASGIVPMQYNYMTGYIYVFIMVLLGFCLVLFFIRQEKAGKIRKLGAEEAALEQQEVTKAEVQKLAEDGVVVAATPWESGNVEAYTPGYLLPKLGMCIAGILITAASLQQAWRDLDLLVRGKAGQALVSAVILRKTGLPEVVIGNQGELTERTKEIGAGKDYGWTFYNQLSFDPGDGSVRQFQRDVGSKLHPPLPILDDDGLPSSVAIRYDPSNLSYVSLPTEYSTWFTPTLLLILGVMTTFTGGVLAWHARRPIVLHSSASLNVAQPV